jgi:hypothetical protein
MPIHEIEPALDRAEHAVRVGKSLKGTGFWPAVAAVRRDPALAERFADRIGDIDRRAFEAGVTLRVPALLGIAVLAVGTAVGVVLLYAGVSLTYTRPWVSVVLFVAGLGAVIVCSHSLTHWLVGDVVGIKFTHVFLGGPPPPRPGVKSDYASYLRTHPRSRALMHASGAVVTKLVPFALLPAAVVQYDRRPWMTWILLVVGVFQIVTDVLFSTKVSDWKKVRRELAASRGGSGE